MTADLNRAEAGAGLDQTDVAAGSDQTRDVDSDQTARGSSRRHVETLNDHTTEATAGADETERPSTDVELPLDVPIFTDITARIRRADEAIQRAHEAIAAQRAEAHATDEAYRKQREARYNRGPETENPEADR